MGKKERNELFNNSINIKRASEFNATKKIEHYLYVDEINQMFAVPCYSIWTGELKKEKMVFFKFSEIQSIEVQDETQEYTKTYAKTKGGLGSAVVGGLLFGAPGAIVGGLTGKRKTTETSYLTTNKSYVIHIVMNTMRIPCLDICCRDRTMLNYLTSVFQIIMSFDKNVQNNDNSIDAIKKFKELFDMGAITEKEYEERKKELLGYNEKNEESNNISNSFNYGLSDIKNGNEKEDFELQRAENIARKLLIKEFNEYLYTGKKELLYGDEEKNNILNEIGKNYGCLVGEVATNLYYSILKQQVEEFNVKQNEEAEEKIEVNTKQNEEVEEKIEVNTKQNEEDNETNTKQNEEVEEKIEVNAKQNEEDNEDNETNTKQDEEDNEDNEDNEINTKQYQKYTMFIWIFLVLALIFSCGLAFLGIIILRIIAFNKDNLDKKGKLYKFVEISKIEKFVNGFIGVCLILWGIVFLEQFKHGFFMILSGISCFEYGYKKIRKIVPNMKENVIRALRLAIPMCLFGVSVFFSGEITRINIVEDNIDIAINEIIKLEFETNLSNNNAQDFEWQSSDRNIVDVDENGNITGKSEGNAIVTLKSNNGKSDNIIVCVKYVELDEIIIDMPDEIYLDEKVLMNIRFLPENATNKQVTLTSSNENIADITNNILNVKQPGNIVLSAKSNTDILVKKNITIKSRPIEKFEMNIPDVMVVGNEYDLKLEIEPSVISANYFDLTTSNSKIINIKNNKIIPISSGKVSIKAKYIDGTVFEKEIKSIVVADSISLGTESINLKKDNTYSFVTSFYPKNTTDQSVSWATSDPMIATVDEKGKVKGVNKGTAIITVSTSNNKIATCIVNVQEKSPVTIKNMTYWIDSLGGVSWDFYLKNNTNKSINYIRLKWYCYNRLNDLIYDEITGINYVKSYYTGPLKAGATTTKLSLNRTFYNNSYKYNQIYSIEIDYSDGTSEQISGDELQYYYDIRS